MKVKAKMVVVAVLASLSCGVSVAHAGFNETPYVTYLSAEEFDAVAMSSIAASANVESVSAIRAVEISLKTAVAKNVSESTTTVALATACAAEEIGYYAPCI